ncbi:MAG: alpha/beta hydrolase [Clostridia bacterium]|nr:alpha/beta hydrolase [Clostridia bacterium]
MSTSVVRDIPYTASRTERNCYDLHMPGGDGDCPLIIYFYGGSLKKGKKDKNALAPRAAEHGMAVAIADYRLFPKAKYPDFINDAADAVAAIIRDIGKYTDRISKIYVGGHSAGAYLCMMLCFDRHYLAERGVDRSQIAGWLLLSGQPTKHFSVAESEGLDPRVCIIDDTAALYHIRSGEGEPLLIATSDRDMTCRREQNLLLAATLRHFEYSSPIHFVDLEGATHSGMVKPDKQGNIPLMPHILNFINQT